MAKAPQMVEVPEVDAIDGLPLPREQNRLIGHEKAEHELLNAYRSPRLHHAWILGGPKGIGKATLAFRFARFVLSNPDRFSNSVQEAYDLSVSEAAHAAHMVAAGSHADLLHLRRPWDEKGKRFKKDLPVDEVRKTVSFFGSTSAGGTWRICIVDSADEMNTSAANALLKILEEPPERSLFLLLSHNPGRLLPTIKSRCRRLELRKLSDDQLIQGLRDLGAVPESLGSVPPALLSLADGSLRQAALAANGGALEIAQAFEGLTASMPNLDLAHAHQFADSVAMRGADDAWATFLDLARGFLTQQVRIHAAHGPRELVRWAEVWEKVGRAARAADALNLDRKQVVLSFLFDLRDEMAAFASRTS